MTTLEVKQQDEAEHRVEDKPEPRFWSSAQRTEQRRARVFPEPLIPAWPQARPSASLHLCAYPESTHGHFVVVVMSGERIQVKGLAL